MATHNETGVKGEGLAADYLKSKNYTILATNWRSGSYEVDIIAQKDDTVAIVEVKTRSSSAFGEPEAWVTKQKQRNLIKAAEIFITSKNMEVEVRFDIISILYVSGKHQVNHIEDAFYPIV
jgi:putative endonuclease